jgi:hypothetical protein
MKKARLKILSITDYHSVVSGTLAPYDYDQSTANNDAYLGCMFVIDVPDNQPQLQTECMLLEMAADSGYYQLDPHEYTIEMQNENDGAWTFAEGYPNYDQIIGFQTQE